MYLAAAVVAALSLCISKKPTNRGAPRAEEGSMHIKDRPITAPLHDPKSSAEYLTRRAEIERARAAMPRPTAPAAGPQCGQARCGTSRCGAADLEPLDNPEG